MREHVFRPKRRVGDKVRVAKLWRGRFKLPGELAATEIPLHTSEKTIAVERLHAIVREKQNERFGIVPPKALREGAAKLLKDHLSDFAADLRARGRDAKYVENIENMVGRVIEERCWLHPKDVTPDEFVAWRSEAAKKLAPKTLNEYLNNLNGLLNWMERQGRLLANPLKCVQKVETRGREVRVRRAVNDDQLGKLLLVAGPRKVVYLAACLTGLRRNELASLRWDDVHLDAVRPFARVRATTTKNHLSADLFLRDDLVAELVKLRPADVEGSVAVFGKLPTMDVFRADLAAAGIPEVDGQGRRFDFHALRHTFATNLSRGGVGPRVAMKLMRHSDLRLTMNVYTDPYLLESDDALATLARFDDQGPEAAAALATGTYAKSDTPKTHKPLSSGVLRCQPLTIRAMWS